MTFNPSDNEILDAKIKEIDEKILKAENSVEETDLTHFNFEKAKLYKENKLKSQAIAEFKKVIEKSQSFNLRMDSVFEILHIGIFDKDLDLVKENIDLCKKFLKEGGDWGKRNRLKVYEGLYGLLLRNFKDSGKLFLEALMTFTNYELFDYKTFVFYLLLELIPTIVIFTLYVQISKNHEQS